MLIERGAEAAFGDCCCVEEELDQTVCDDTPVAAAADEAVEMEGPGDFGNAAEWARKVARKLEKNGRLLVMVGMPDIKPAACPVCYASPEEGVSFVCVADRLQKEVPTYPPCRIDVVDPLPRADGRCCFFACTELSQRTIYAFSKHDRCALQYRNKPRAMTCSLAEMKGIDVHVQVIVIKVGQRRALSDLLPTSRARVESKPPDFLDFSPPVPGHLNPSNITMHEHRLFAPLEPVHARSSSFMNRGLAGAESLLRESAIHVFLKDSVRIR